MNGCLKCWKKIRILLIGGVTFLLMMHPILLSAQEISDIELPSSELIEFLGAFEDDDAGWIDPFELLGMEPIEQENTSAEDTDNDKS